LVVAVLSTSTTGPPASTDIVVRRPIIAFSCRSVFSLTSITRPIYKRLATIPREPGSRTTSKLVDVNDRGVGSILSTMTDGTNGKRVAILTGGTGGLGTALTKRLFARKHRIGATYLVPDEATAYENAFGKDEDELLLRRVNAVEPQEITAFMSEAYEHFGRIDALACLVGGWAGGKDVVDTDDVRFDRMLDLNLRSAFYSVRAAIPHLEASGGGSILLIGSRAALEAPAGQAAFNIAKAGVVALAKTAALEVEEANIAVNVILPSVIDTPATREALPFSDYVKWPTPDEIAAVAEYLLSGESVVISGAAIPVYGKA
jgi:NAD(P)-dependent dehydrogenase (short-subunit alcohol dehydrogenase family)